MSRINNLAFSRSDLSMEIPLILAIFIAPAYSRVGYRSSTFCPSVLPSTFVKGERWPSGRALDSRAKGPGFEPHGCRVSLSKTL